MSQLDYMGVWIVGTGLLFSEGYMVLGSIMAVLTVVRVVGGVLNERTSRSPFGGVK